MKYLLYSLFIINLALEGSLGQIYDIVNDVLWSCNSSLSDVDCASKHIHKLPSMIEFKRETTYVTFANNDISVIVENTFYRGPEVEILDFSNNKISFIAPSSFQGFESLSELYLSHNRLTKLTEKIFDGVPYLRVLDLSHNELTSFYPNIFLPCLELMQLKISHNPLTKLGEEDLKYLPNLEKLDLQATNLEDISAHLFDPTNRLKHLSLASNNLKKVPTECLSNLKQLTSLDLSDNKIKIINTHSFFGLTNLTTLYLNNQSELTDIEQFAFSHLNNLTTLQCSHNPKLSYIHPMAFQSKPNKYLANLHQVFLRNNTIHTLPEEILLWEQISFIDIQDNPWKCDCDLLWMVDTEIMRDMHEDARCSSPSQLEGISIAALEDQDFACHSWLTKRVLMAAVILTIIAVVSSIFSMVCITCKFNVCTPVRAKWQRRYREVLPEKEKMELEWDYTI